MNSRRAASRRRCRRCCCCWPSPSAACGKKQPPIARPIPPPPPPPRRRSRRRPSPPPPRRGADDRPPAPVPEDAIASASLDEINKNSPLKPVFFELDASEIDSAGQQALDGERRSAEALPHLADQHRGTLRRARDGRIQPGARRAARDRRAQLSRVAGHLRRSREDGQLRQGIPVRSGPHARTPGRRTAARTSS